MLWDIRKRCKTLDAFINAFLSIRSDITLSHKELETVIHKHIHDPYCGKAMEMCEKQLSLNRRPNWINAVKDTVLAEGEKQIFSVLDILGTGDLTNQISILDEFINMLKNAKQQAYSEQREKGKMYVSCSFLAGAALALIII